MFIDLRKAFDSLDHTVLLEKLTDVGVTGRELGWFADYLANRSQVVEFQGVFSKPEAISAGLPQESILGP